jgi:hypothetical protein
MVEEIHQLLCVLGTLYLKLEYTMLPKLVNEIADLSQCVSPRLDGLLRY